MELIRKNYRIIVIGLLSIFFFLVSTSSIQENLTVDEGVHLAAGYSYWMKHDFRMNPEHPPLLKELAGLPLVIINHHLKQPFDLPSWSQPNEWQFAKDFIYYNHIPADIIIFLGRLPFMLLGLVLGYYIFRWSRELFGTLAGLFSLALYAFSPDMIAHSHYITTDIGVALFFFLTIYYFYNFLKYHKKSYFWLTAVFFGLAQASKFSAVILIPILPALFIIFCGYYKERKLSLCTWKKGILILLTIFIVGSAIISITYFLEVKRPFNDAEIQNLYTQQNNILQNNQLSAQPPTIQTIINFTNPDHFSGKIIKSILTKFPVPAYSYFRGFVQLYSHNYYGHTAYLLGHYTNFGWWYYFPLAFLVKEPVSLLLFLLFIIVYPSINFIKNKKYLTSFKKWWRNIPLYLYFLIIPSLVYLLWSLTSHLNLGIRHIFILFPFIFCGSGYLVKIINNFRKRNKYLLALLLAYYIISSLLIYPHFLAYFNEPSGGPNSGPKYLVDSNIDWGQDLKNLKKYMDKNSIDHVCLSYFGQAKIEYYGIDYWYLPDTQNFHTPQALNCVVAISVTSLYSEAREFGWLLNYSPTTKIGYSIYVYDFRNK